MTWERSDPEFEMNISRATLEDLDGVITLLHRCIENMESCGIHQWDDIYPGVETFESDIEKNNLYVTKSDGRLCVAAAIDEEQPPEYRTISWKLTEGRILVVHRLCVDPDFQGRGYAGSAMRFIENYAHRNGYASIRLDAFTKNPAAVRLYRGRGYRLAGTVDFRKGPFYCFELEVRLT